MSSMMFIQKFRKLMEIDNTPAKKTPFRGSTVTEYLLEEIYGLADVGKDDGAHDETSHGEPCVVCLSDPRNTAILPCRHLCLCEECARELTIGAQLRGDTCPICRGKIQTIQVFELKS
eukprot:s2075_g2.t1